MVVLSLRPIQAVLLDPGALGQLGELTAGAYGKCSATDDGGQGFLVFLRNSAIVASPPW